MDDNAASSHGVKILMHVLLCLMVSMADVGGAHTELSPDTLDLIKTFELLY